MEAKPKANLRRHLDHLGDFQAGVHFTAMPAPLRDLWFDGKIKDSKVKLIMMMLGHSSSFVIKLSYLRKRISSSKLFDLLKEIEEDGVVRKEQVKCGAGKPWNIYHTNPIAEWRLREFKGKRPLGPSADEMAAKLPEEPAPLPDETPENPATLNGSDSNHLEPENPATLNGSDSNRSNSNLYNKNKANQKKRIRIQNPGAKNAPGDSDRKISKERLVGAVKAIYEPTVGREVITSLVEELLEEHSREAILIATRRMRDKVRWLCKWEKNHPEIWQRELLGDEKPSPRDESAQEEGPMGSLVDCTF